MDFDTTAEIARLEKMINSLAETCPCCGRPNNTIDVRALESSVAFALGQIDTLSEKINKIHKSKNTGGW